MYNFTQLQEKLQGNISPDRYNHSLGVVKIVDTYAKNYNLNIESARIAALLHDCAKEIPIEQQQMYVEKYFINELYQDEWDLPKMWHTWVGYILAEEEYGIYDIDILNAIRWHVTGDSDMNDLAKFIFLADFIEENRSDSSLSKMIKKHFENQELLDKIMRDVLAEKEKSLKEKKRDMAIRSEMLKQSIEQRLQ